MFPFNAKLFGLLLLQLIVAASLYLLNHNNDNQQSQVALFNINKQDINGIEIIDNESTVLLKKDNDQWQLPNWHHLPVNQNKLDAILNSLSKLKAGWPIATTTSSHQRFKVAEDNFQRRIRLLKNDKAVVEFFLGTSPGFRKVHLRLQGDNKVYSVPLNTYDFPTKSNDWLWKQLLAINNVKSIETQDFSLQKTDQGWRFKNAPDLLVNQDKAKQWVQALNGLTVTSLVEDEVDLSNAEKQTYQVNNDRPYTLNFYHKDSHYYVGRTDFNSLLFKLTEFEYNRVAGITKDDLIQLESANVQEDNATDAPSSEQAPTGKSPNNDKLESAEKQPESTNEQDTNS